MARNKITIGGVQYTVGAESSSKVAFDKLLQNYEKTRKIKFEFSSDADKTIGDLSKQQQRLKGEAESISKALQNQQAALRNLYQATGQEGAKTVRELTAVRDRALAFSRALQQAGDTSSKEFREMTLAAAQAERSIAGIEGRLSRLGLGEQVLRALGPQFNLLANSAGRMGQSVGLVGQQLGLIPVQAQLAVAGIGLVKAGFDATIRAAADQEEAIRAARLTLEATTEQEKLLAQAAKQIGVELKTSALEVARTFEQLGTQGVSLEQVLDGAGAATLRLARATKTSGETSAAIFGQVSQLYKDVGINFENVADIITNSANKTALTVQDFNEAVGQGGRGIKLANVDLAIFAASIATIKPSASGASDAATAFSNAIQRIFAPTKQGAEILKTWGVSAYDSTGQAKPLIEVIRQLETATAGLSDKARNAKLTELLGADGLKGLLPLLKEGADNLDTLAKSLGTAGSAADQADKRFETLRGSQVRFANAWQNFLTADPSQSPILRAITRLTTDAASLLERYSGTAPLTGQAGAIEQTAKQVKRPLTEGERKEIAALVKESERLAQNIEKIRQLGSLDPLFDESKSAIPRFQNRLNEITERLSQFTVKTVEASGAQKSLNAALQEFGKGARITQEAGANKNSLFYGPRGHDGLDIAIPGGIGAKVFAPSFLEGAKVLDVANIEEGLRRAGWTEEGARKAAKAYGTALLVEFQNGEKAILGHFNSLTAKVGQVIQKGDLLGNQGSTGNSTGPHVHIGFLVNGKVVYDQAAITQRITGAIAGAVKTSGNSSPPVSNAPIDEVLNRARALVERQDRATGAQAIAVQAEIKRFEAFGERYKLAIDIAQKEKQQAEEDARRAKAETDRAKRERDQEEKRILELEQRRAADKFATNIESQTSLPKLRDLLATNRTNAADRSLNIDERVEAFRRYEVILRQIEKLEDQVLRKSQAANEARVRVVESIGKDKFTDALGNKTDVQLKQLEKTTKAAFDQARSADEIAKAGQRYLAVLGEIDKREESRAKKAEEVAKKIIPITSALNTNFENLYGSASGAAQALKILLGDASKFADGRSPLTFNSESLFGSASGARQSLRILKELEAANRELGIGKSIDGFELRATKDQTLEGFRTTWDRLQAEAADAGYKSGNLFAKGLLEAPGDKSRELGAEVFGDLPAITYFLGQKSIGQYVQGFNLSQNKDQVASDFQSVFTILSLESAEAGYKAGNLFAKGLLEAPGDKSAELGADVFGDIPDIAYAVGQKAIGRLIDGFNLRDTKDQTLEGVRTIFDRLDAEAQDKGYKAGNLFAKGLLEAPGDKSAELGTEVFGDIPAISYFLGQKSIGQYVEGFDLTKNKDQVVSDFQSVYTILTNEAKEAGFRAGNLFAKGLLEAPADKSRELGTGTFANVVDIRDEEFRRRLDALPVDKSRELGLDAFGFDADRERVRVQGLEAIARQQDRTAKATDTLVQALTALGQAEDELLSFERSLGLVEQAKPFDDQIANAQKLKEQFSDFPVIVESIDKLIASYKRLQDLDAKDKIRIAGVEALNLKYTEQQNAITRLGQSYNELNNIKGELDAAMGNVQPYQSTLDRLEDLKRVSPELAAEIDELIEKFLKLQKASELQTLVNNIDSAFRSIQQLFDSGNAQTFGQGFAQFGAGIGGLVSLIPGAGVIGQAIKLGTDIAGWIFDGIDQVFNNNSGKIAKDIEQLGKQLTFIDKSVFNAAITTYEEEFLFGLIKTTKFKFDEAKLELVQTIAQSLEGGIAGGLKNGIEAALTGDGDPLQLLKDGLASGVASAVADGIIQGAVVEGALGKLLTDLTAAMAAGDYDAAAAIVNNIAAGLPALVGQLEFLVAPIRDALAPLKDPKKAVEDNKNSSPTRVELPQRAQIAVSTVYVEATRQFREGVTQFNRGADSFERTVKLLTDAVSNLPEQKPSTTPRKKSNTALLR